MAQTVAAELRALAVKEQKYQQAMRRKLESIIRPGKGNSQWMGPTTAQFGYKGPSNATNLKFGQQISERDVLDFINKSGGSPYAKQRDKLQSLAKTAAARQAELPKDRSVSRRVNETIKAQPSLIESLAQRFQFEQDRANYENQRRYDEGHGELSTLRNRNSERVKNWGKASKADLEERFSQNLADVTANLSGRGLGNSTIVSAFEAKNARDLAREQQRLSETVDDRASRYDSTDTRSLVDFVERRDDVGPDFS